MAVTSTFLIFTAQMSLHWKSFKLPYQNQFITDFYNSKRYLFYSAFFATGPRALGFGALCWLVMRAWWCRDGWMTDASLRFQEFHFLILVSLSLCLIGPSTVGPSYCWRNRSCCSCLGYGPVSLFCKRDWSSYAIWLDFAWCCWSLSLLPLPLVF